MRASFALRTALFAGYFSAWGLLNWWGLVGPPAELGHRAPPPWLMVISPAIVVGLMIAWYRFRFSIPLQVAAVAILGYTAVLAVLAQRYGRQVMILGNPLALTLPMLVAGSGRKQAGSAETKE